MPSVHESSPSALALVSTFTVKSCGIMVCQRIGREEVNSWRIAGRTHQAEWCRLSILVVHQSIIHTYLNYLSRLSYDYVSALSGPDLLLFLGGFFSVLRLPVLLIVRNKQGLGAF